MRACFTLWVLVLVSCSHISTDGCRDATVVAADVRRVATRTIPWDKITPDVFAEILPHNFDGGSQNRGFPERPCSGSSELVRHDRVISGDYQCVLLALFSERVAERGCSESLEAVVVRHTFASREGAERMAAILLAEISPPTSPHQASAVGPHHWDDFPVQGQRTAANIQVSRVERGWQVYLWFSRSVV